MYLREGFFERAFDCDNEQGVEYRAKVTKMSLARVTVFFVLHPRTLSGVLYTPRGAAGHRTACFASLSGVGSSDQIFCFFNYK